MPFYDYSTMMPSLDLALLGTFPVQHSSHTLTEFYSNGVRALLAYLAVEADRPHERTLIGELLWPDEPTAKGLLNLRQAIYRLDQALIPAALPVPFTQTTRQTVQLNPALDLNLDVRQFIRLIAVARTHRHRRLTVCGPCLAALREAVALYRGDFLAGFSASAPFDEWQAVWRARLRAQTIWALDTLVLHHEQRGEWDAACAQLRHWLELEPWCEEAHRRLMVALVSAGQRSAALAQYEICRRILARELDTTPDPTTTNLVARLRVSTPATWFAPPYAVPTVETPLMGRTAALAALAAQLASPVGRLLTLTGPGGSGKTRLALAAAAAERGTFTDGIFFVSLVPVDDADGLVAAIAEGLHLPMTAEHCVTVSTLSTHLKAREVLLVLDNFEPLLAYAPLLGTLRDAAPNLRILVTSRVPLHLLDEEVLRVGGLEPATSTDADDPAIRLFVQAARRVAPDFTPTDADLVTISMISQALDRLPLTLKLAAGLVDHLDPAAILALVWTDPDALESDLRDLPERHRSIRNLFASSWRLLPDKQQQILAYCALFAASFSRAAVVVVAMGGTPGNAMRDRMVGRSLAALSDHALLQRVGPDRYALHPLVRQFASEYYACLPTAEQAASRARHRAYFLGLMAQHADAIVGPTGQAVVELLRIELADIHLAWHNASLDNDLALMGAATHGLLDLLRIGELHAVGSFTFTAAITRLRSTLTNDHDASPLARHTLVQLLIAHAEMCFIQGDHATVMTEAQAAAELAHALGNPELEGEAQFAWGKGLRRQGAIQAAQAQFAHGARLIRACQDSPALRRLRSDLHRYMGLGAWSFGHFASTHAHYHASLRLAQSIDYRYGEGNIRYGLSLVANMQGDYSEALEHSTVALAIFRASGNRTGEESVLITLGLARMYRGEDTAAQSAFAAHGRVYEFTGDRQIEVINTILSGAVSLRLGDYAAARTTLANGLATGQALDYRWGNSIGLTFIGLLRHLTGDQHGAVAACREALAITEQSGDIVIGSHALTHLGHALAALGNITEATACYERAVAIRRAVSQVHLVPEPLAGLIELALARGDLPTALAHSETILATYAQTHLAGPEEPSRIILACYRSLLLAEDTRAGALIIQAAQQLRERAARLTNPDQQATLCEAVAANHTLLALADAAMAAGSDRNPALDKVQTSVIPA